MHHTHHRGSIVIKLIVLGAIVAGLYYTKAPDGKSYLDKAVWAVKDGIPSVLGQAQAAKAEMQAHEDAAQKMLNE